MLRREHFAFYLFYKYYEILLLHYNFILFPLSIYFFVVLLQFVSGDLLGCIQIKRLGLIDYPSLTPNFLNGNKNAFVCSKNVYLNFLFVILNKYDAVDCETSVANAAP